MTLPYGTDPGGPIRVLHVEDDPALATLVRKALVRRGHDVEHVTNGDAALARIAAGGIDILALDHSLPGETGFDLLARIGPRGTRPPIVYVTASGDARLAVDALKQGADDFVVKDASSEFFDLLIAALEQAYERWRLRSAKAEAEKAVREARDRAEMLLKEVNHRVANSLGLVAAMVRMQASLVTDPVALHALQETQNRVAAIAGVHRHLYTADHVGEVEIGEYLGHLVDELGTAMRGEGADHGLVTDFDRIAVSTDRAVSLGVVVGELVTNAFKYAYPDGVPGEIRVSARREEDGVRVVVEDDGIGSGETAEARGTGLGSRIVKAMARNLDATVELDPAHRGTRVTIRFTP